MRWKRAFEKVCLDFIRLKTFTKNTVAVVRRWCVGRALHIIVMNARISNSNSNSNVWQGRMPHRLRPLVGPISHPLKFPGYNRVLLRFLGESGRFFINLSRSLTFAWSISAGSQDFLCTACPKTKVPATTHLLGDVSRPLSIPELQCSHSSGKLMQSENPNLIISVIRPTFELTQPTLCLKKRH